MNRAIFRTAGAIFLFALAGIIHADQAQPTLPTIPISIGGKNLVVEVADTDETRAMGLMFRDQLEDGTGMLFVMDEPAPAWFWMKNTRIPLSIAYISALGMILEIYDMEPHDESQTASEFGTVAYALEVPQGWFEKNGVVAGDTVDGLPALPSEF